MKSKLTFLVIICGLVTLFFAGNFFNNPTSVNDKLNNPNKFNGIKSKLEDGVSNPVINRDRKPPVRTVNNTPLPTDTVPGLWTYNDYTTNGNSLSQVLVSGDTIVVLNTYIDSLSIADPNGTNSLRIRYNCSFDGGVTWVGANDLSNAGKSRYPDGSILTIAGQRTVAATGRYWEDGVSTTRRPGGSFDVQFGAGSVTLNLMPTGISNGSDLFSYARNDNKKACMLQTLGVTGDSLLYFTWDPGAGTYSAKKVIDTRTLTNTVCAYNIGASDNASHMTAAWCYVNEPTSGGDPIRSIRYSTSVDGGNTWTASAKINANAFLNGDSAQSYWHTEVCYRPNSSTPYVAFSTADYTTTYVLLADQRRAWKIAVWSPTLNGGNAVVVADWHNIPFMADTVQVGLALSHPAVNEALFGHPSLGFSSDGSVLYCTFSVAQPEFSAANFNYHDVWLTYSLDQGATWAANPINVSSTPAWDEVYPSMAANGNTNNAAYVSYLSTSEPGCAVFTDGAPIAIVHQVLKKVETPIGIINISNEVPAKFSLHQNFPNPFNPSTKIRFELSKSANVTISVYNMAGQLVATLANNEFVNAGTKEITFDAANYASGVYFYKLTAADFSETKKMVLIK